MSALDVGDEIIVTSSAKGIEGCSIEGGGEIGAGEGDDRGDSSASLFGEVGRGERPLSCDGLTASASLGLMILAWATFRDFTKGTKPRLAEGESKAGG